MFKNKYVILRNLALLLIICNTVYWFFPFRPIVWRIGLVLLAIYLDLFVEDHKLPCEKAVLVFTFFNIIHFFLSFLWSNPSLTQIGNILCAMLTLSMFTLFAQKGVMTEKFMTWVGLLLLPVALAYYYYYSDMAHEWGNLDADVSITNNGSGIFMFLLPLLFLIKNNIQKWVTMAVSLAFIVMGAKRGYILAAAIPVLIFVHNELKDQDRSFLKTIGVLVMVFVGGFYLYRLAINSSYLMYRWETTLEGNSSGRDEIYSTIWNSWLGSTNQLAYLFGYGFDATTNIGSHAHSDWLEILYDYGLFGIVLYLLVFVRFFQQIPKIKGNNMKKAFIACVFVWLLPSIYSMGFTSGSMAILMITMGTVLGSYKRDILLT